MDSIYNSACCESSKKECSLLQSRRWPLFSFMQSISRVTLCSCKKKRKDKQNSLDHCKKCYFKSWSASMCTYWLNAPEIKFKLYLGYLKIPNYLYQTHSLKHKNYYVKIIGLETNGLSKWFGQTEQWRLWFKQTKNNKKEPPQE